LVGFRAKLNDNANLRKFLKDWCICVTVNHLRGMPYGIPQEDEFWKSAGYIGGNNWYVLTPSGQILSHDIEEGIAKWLKLPAEERKPGAVKVGEPPQRPIRGVTPPVPDGGLIIRIYMRQLERDQHGKFIPFRYPQQSPLGPRDMTKALEEPGVDALWLSSNEVRSLAPSNPKLGDTFEVPDPVKWRIIRAHLVDGVGGLIFPWEKNDVRHHAMTLTVENVTSELIRLRLDGKVRLSTYAENPPSQVKSGFEPTLLGYLDYDRQKDTLRRFDVVAVGNCWSSTRQVRSLHPDLGIVFELNAGQTPADLVQPRCHWINPGAYFQMEK
jgi:hypothetical protein